MQLKLKLTVLHDFWYRQEATSENVSQKNELFNVPSLANFYRLPDQVRLQWDNLKYSADGVQLVAKSTLLNAYMSLREPSSHIRLTAEEALLFVPTDYMFYAYILPIVKYTRSLIILHRVWGAKGDGTKGANIIILVAIATLASHLLHHIY